VIVNRRCAPDDSLDGAPVYRALGQLGRAERRIGFLLLGDGWNCQPAQQGAGREQSRGGQSRSRSHGVVSMKSSRRAGSGFRPRTSPVVARPFSSTVTFSILPVNLNGSL